MSRPPDPKVEQVDSILQDLQNPITHEQISKMQRDCTEIHNLRQGIHKKGLNIQDVNFGQHQILCEVSNKPRPILPPGLRSLAIQTFHSLDHFRLGKIHRQVLATARKDAACRHGHVDLTILYGKNINLKNDTGD